MSQAHDASYERALALLADAATDALVADTAEELDDLLSHHSELRADEFELTAAAINLALLSSPLEPLRSPVRERILNDAGRFLEGCYGQERETGE